MRVLIDLDSIIVDLMPTWLGLYNAEYDDDLAISDIHSWDTHLFTKVECDTKVYEYLRRPGLFRNLPPIPGAIEGVRALVEQGHEIYVVTAAPDGSATEKIEWVKEHLPFLGHKRVVICYHKQVVDGDVLIDDGPHNLTNWRAAHPNGRTVSIKYPYNRDTKVDYVAGSYLDTKSAWRNIGMYGRMLHKIFSRPGSY